MTRHLTRALAAAIAVGSLALAGACSSASGEPAVIVGAANFSESTLLANMYQQILEKNGISAKLKQLSTREIYEPALEKGEVQVMPEYLGTFAEFLNKKVNGPKSAPVASGDGQSTLKAARELAKTLGLEILTPSSAQDQNAFAVTESFAKENNVATLSELGEASAQKPVVLGGPPECPSRPFCQPGLSSLYGVNVSKFVSLDAGGPLTVGALNQGKIDVGLVFSSAGNVASNSLVVLKDDKGLQTVDNLTPVINKDVRTDELVKALDSVSKALTTEDLAQLNSQVDSERKDPKSVASEFLKSKGLL